MSCKVELSFIQKPHCFHNFLDYLIEIYTIRKINYVYIKTSCFKYDEPIARWLVNWRNLTYFEFPKEVSVMTMKDYQKLLSVPDLFCRKVRSDISKDLLDELDKENL